MRKNQTSLTAMGIAVLRAVGSDKPETERICYDPYARQFLPGWFYHTMRFFIHTGYAERRGRGFTQIANTWSEDLKSMHFHGKNAARQVMPGYGIVTAVVMG